MLPGPAQSLARAQRALADTFAAAGYARVYTPLFELMDVLQVGLSEHERRSSFRMVDPARGEVVVLRPDFTAQVARIASSKMASLPRPLRLSYQGRVARAADPLGRGLRRRDVFQSGIELIGADARWADVEVLVTGASAIAALGCPLTLDIGHAAIVSALVAETRDPRAAEDALARKDTAALRRLAPDLEPLAHLYGPRPVLAEAQRVLCAAPEAVQSALQTLIAVADRLSAAAPEVDVVFDLGAPRQHGYYTGLFFSGYAPGAPDAVLTGGRYDELLGRFGSPEPAVGLGVDLGLVVGRSANPEPHGVVVAESNLDQPRWADHVAQIRARGERAVAVDAAQAEGYARAHGFRAVLSAGPDGLPIERPI